MAKEPGVLAPPTAEPSPQPRPEETLAQYPGEPVELPIILWVGAGKFFQRLVKEGTFDELLQRHGAHFTVIDLRRREDITLLPGHQNVRYYDVSDGDQRRQLLYNRTGEQHRTFTHCYIANWPDGHLLSAVKYSALASGGDIIVTKPLDLNIPMVKTIQRGLFPDLNGKLFVDDHYRNKGSVRALHAMFSRFHDSGLNYGAISSFRMWLVEPSTAESEGRLPALECGVIWDLVTHLVSFIQMFFLDPPHVGLSGYVKGDSRKLRNVRLEIRKVLRRRYVGCELRNQNAETLAVIEVAIPFEYETYAGWENATVRGLLVVAKGATRGQGVTGSVKQIDFRFDRGPVNLNYNSGNLVPELRDYHPSKEHGFYKSVVELLTHASRRPTRLPSSGGGFFMPEPGRYHCAMPFPASYQNVMIIDDIIHHSSGRKLLQGYPQGEDIRTIMDWLVGRDHLEKDWLDEGEYGKWV